MVFISTIIFCFIVSGIASSNNIYTILVIAGASALGSYFSSKISDCFEKDATYINTVTSAEMSAIVHLDSYLTQHDIKHILFKTLNLQGKESLTVQAICKTKKDSRKLDQYLAKEDIFFRNISR